MEELSFGILPSNRVAFLYILSGQAMYISVSNSFLESQLPVSVTISFFASKSPSPFEKFHTGLAQKVHKTFWSYCFFSLAIVFWNKLRFSFTLRSSAGGVVVTTNQ